jgi:prevent-host-death family protein
MTTISAFEAKTRFEDLLERVSRGEEIVITKHQKPIARLVPEGRPAITEIRSPSTNSGVFVTKWQAVAEHGRSWTKIFRKPSKRAAVESPLESACIPSLMTTDRGRRSTGSGNSPTNIRYRYTTQPIWSWLNGRVCRWRREMRNSVAPRQNVASQSCSDDLQSYSSALPSTSISFTLNVTVRKGPGTPGI